MFGVSWDPGIRPTAEFEPVRPKGRRRSLVAVRKRYKTRPPRLLEPDAEGQVNVDGLNAEFDSLYLETEANPRWVAKPVVAYLWGTHRRVRGLSSGDSAAQDTLAVQETRQTHPPYDRSTRRSRGGFRRGDESGHGIGIGGAETKT